MSSISLLIFSLVDKDAYNWYFIDIIIIAFIIVSSNQRLSYLKTIWHEPLSIFYVFKRKFFRIANILIWIYIPS